MTRQFDVEWDDFTGGYYVGNSDVKQPHNTWKGDDVLVTADNSYLCPMYPFQTVSTIATFGAKSALNISGTGSSQKFSISDTVSTRQGSTLGSLATISHPTVSSARDQVHFNKWVVGPQGGVAKAYVFDWQAGTVTGVTVPAVLTIYGVYKTWVVGCAAGSNRMYFCDVMNPLSWVSSNYVDIGMNGTDIITFVNATDGLYVGTTVGWFVVSGVLGTTTTVRQITQLPVLGKGVFANGAVLSGATNASSGTSGYSMRTLHGAHEEASMFFGTNMEFARFGKFLVGMNGTRVYVMSMLEGHGWQKRTMPTLTGLAGYPFLGICDDLAMTTLYITDPDVSSTPVLSASVEASTPDAVSGVFSSSTVALADYQHGRQFQVKELIVEVVQGTYVGAPPVRSLGVQLKCPSVFADQTALGSSLQPSTVQQTITFPNTREQSQGTDTFRFTPNDTAPTFRMEPNITLQGCMLRRVIARCQEVS